jgi:GNAT superfamily N-acetyltransferase
MRPILVFKPTTYMMKNMEWGEIMRLKIREIKGEKEIRETSEIYIECWQNDYVGFIPPETLNNLNIDNEAKECGEWLEQDERNQLFAGFLDHKMVGYISVSPHTEEPKAYQMEISGLFVRKDYRNKGFGIELLSYAVRELINQEVKRIIVYSYQDSGSNGYYRSLGGEAIKKEIQYVEGKPLEVVCFGWDTKNLLINLEKKLEKYL